MLKSRVEIRFLCFLTFLEFLLDVSGYVNQCGNSACCQSANYGPAFSGPYSIFNAANIGYGQAYSLAANGYLGGAGYDCARTTSLTTCLNIDAIPVSFLDLSCNQPVYVRMMEDSSSAMMIDNVCVTYFPVPDNPDTFLTYISYVDVNGTNTVMSTVDTQSAIGVFTLSTATTSFQHKYIASAGNLLVGCTRSVYGNPMVSTLFASTYDLLPLSVACVNEVSRLVACSGLDDPGLYILPYNFPPQCVLEQPSTIDGTNQASMDTQDAS